MARLQSAVVTGGGSGIGRALALGLAGEGLNVLITGRRDEALREAAAHAPDLIQTLAGDVTTAADQVRIADAARDLPGPLGLFHGAGVFEVGLLTSLDPARWQASFDVNVTARLALTRALLPELKGGRVLFIGSDAAVSPRLGAGAYSVAQAASQMLRDCLGQELTPEGIAVGSFKPGLVSTDMVTTFMAEPEAVFPGVGAYHDYVAEGRIASAEAVAAFARWLLLDTDAAAFAETKWDIRDTSHHAAWLDGPLYPDTDA